MALFRSLFEWVQCFVHRIPRRRKKQGVQKRTEAEWTPMEGVSRPLDVGHIDQTYQTRYCKSSKYLNDKGNEREEKREVGRKRKLKKERKMVDERESGRKEEENKDATPLRIEVKPQPTPPAAEVKTPAASSFIKSSVKEPLVAKRASRHLPPLPTKTRPPSSGEEPMLLQKVLQHHALLVIEVKPLPASSFIKSSEEEPPLSVANLPPRATETKPLGGSFVVDPSSTSSKSPEEEPQMVQSASRNQIPPAIKNIALQSVAKPSMLQRTSRHFAPKPTESKPLRGAFVLEPKMVQRASRRLAPPAEEPSVAEILVVQHKPTESLSHSMEEQLMEQVLLPSRQIPKYAEVKPKSATSSLIQMDTESEEDESVEHTERTIPSSESETNHEQTLEAGVKQKAVFEKVHPTVLEQSGDSEKKKRGDSKADALRKAKELDELMTRLFCVDYSPCPQKEKQQPSRKGQKKPKNKTKTRAGPFSWAEKKLKRINEEKEESEKDENT
ncbi:hypothetical protein G5714_019358 [Onychostoma macrolepis]|uniref:Uncharacterized protein n=1 Tax=Onychostoma macrolepis TaxID=369639 RepID=A0A7J6C047_9TELE|nr:hypothetical protein G5714_019358 [Onychostoma macrolepis]